MCRPIDVYPMTGTPTISKRSATASIQSSRSGQMGSLSAATANIHTISTAAISRVSKDLPNQMEPGNRYQVTGTEPLTNEPAAIGSTTYGSKFRKSSHYYNMSDQAHESSQRRASKLRYPVVLIGPRSRTRLRARRKKLLLLNEIALAAMHIQKPADAYMRLVRPNQLLAAKQQI